MCCEMVCYFIYTQLPRDSFCQALNFFFPKSSYCKTQKQTFYDAAGCPHDSHQSVTQKIKRWLMVSFCFCWGFFLIHSICICQLWLNVREASFRCWVYLANSSICQVLFWLKKTWGRLHSRQQTSPIPALPTELQLHVLTKTPAQLNWQLSIMARHPLFKAQNSELKLSESKDKHFNIHDCAKNYLKW